MMMNLPELVILDVGHGNCALLRDKGEVIIVDCPFGTTLLQTLEYYSINEISRILISHADTDHIAGIISLLYHKNLKIHSVHLNPDAKDTDTWHDLRYALKDARQRGTKVATSLTTSDTGTLNTDEVEVQILAPLPEVVLGTPKGKDLRKKSLSSNSLSVVVRLIHASHPVALLAGDLDHIGLENLLDEDDEPVASILVFPHHGGLPASRKANSFAQLLCERVKPELIIFSNGRGRFGNPREEIIRGITSSSPDIYIWCTQLAEVCSSSLVGLVHHHLSLLPAKGKAGGETSCCGGTIAIQLNGSRTVKWKQFEPHTAFVDGIGRSSPMCRKFLP